MYFDIFIDVLVESSTWNGINVSPLETCYEKPPEKKEDDECTEDMEAENAYEEMETAENAWNLCPCPLLDIYLSVCINLQQFSEWESDP